MRYDKGVSRVPPKPHSSLIAARIDETVKPGVDNPTLAKPFALSHSC